MALSIFVIVRSVGNELHLYTQTGTLCPSISLYMYKNLLRAFSLFLITSDGPDGIVSSVSCIIWSWVRRCSVQTQTCQHYMQAIHTDNTLYPCSDRAIWDESHLQTWVGPPIGPCYIPQCMQSSGIPVRFCTSTKRRH